ncbi:MAG TPA: DUF2231 domain-containing protein [Caldilineae bacterium]|nr:DUF2231 domain-containing protein [Caldilineae bacterium]
MSLDLPLHPGIVHYPIALLVAGAVASLVYEWRQVPWLRYWGTVSLLAGWLLTILALITGLVEKNAIPAGAPAEQVANQHTTAMFTMWILYGLALYWRYRWRDDMQSGHRRLIWATLLILATLILLLAGHLGGTLVYELGVGVK